MPKILVIDDEEDMRLLMATVLRRGDFEIETAPDGASGIDLALRWRPDLVLCDVAMRGLDGYGVLSRLRAAPETARIPVVLVTGLADLRGMREGMKLGADDYLPKPFTVDELQRVVRTRLAKREQLEREAQERARTLRSHISLMLPEELLNPLTGIIGLADILCAEAETLPPAEAAELGRDIQRAGERLHRMIGNFLIYAQIELLATDTERMESLRRGAPVPVARIVEETARRSAEAHQRTGDLVLGPVGGEVRMSEQNLTKLVSELVDNAFRYSKHGAKVSVEAVPVSRNVSIRVSDRGPGIATTVLEDVKAVGQIERFAREKRVTGLGMVIASRLAEVHGGRIAWESRPGEGTVVTVELPGGVAG